MRKPAVPSRESEGHSARLRAHRDLTAAGRGPRGGRAPPAVTPGWGAGRGREEVGMRSEAERSGPPSVGQPGGAGRGAALVGRYLSARLRSDSARLGSRRGRLRSASGAAVSAAAVLARC